MPRDASLHIVLRQASRPKEQARQRPPKATIEMKQSLEGFINEMEQRAAVMA